jgi:chemotaxis protein methyltransferase CheR
LKGSSLGEPISVSSYLSKLCESLADSMIGESRPIMVQVNAEGATVSSSKAVSIGLIVTEGVINALKHAFPEAKEDSHIVVSYAETGSDWKLSIAYNGVGKPTGGPAATKTGLGTSIVNALAQQLDASVELASGPSGTVLSVIHAVPVANLPRAT